MNIFEQFEFPETFHERLRCSQAPHSEIHQRLDDVVYAGHEQRHSQFHFGMGSYRCEASLLFKLFTADK